MVDRAFIAYASADEELANALKQFIEKLFSSAEVFMAGDVLRGGQGWFETIRKELDSSPIVLALTTPNSSSAPWLYFEAGSGFVAQRTIPVCGGTATIRELRPPFSQLQARELTSVEQIEKLASDVSRIWGHGRQPDHALLAREAAALIEASSALRTIEIAPSSEAMGSSDAEEARHSRHDHFQLMRVAQLTLDLNHEAQHWDRVVKLFASNGRTLVQFLDDVYGYKPPEDANWNGRQDDVLRQELAILPTETHRIIIEYHYGVWYEPVPESELAAALHLTVDEFRQKLSSAVSLLRERRNEAVHAFKKEFDWEYRNSQ